MDNLRFNHTNYNEVCEILLNIAKKASLIVKEIYNNSKIQFEKKPDKTPITLADKESNNIIVHELNKHFKECLVISEEEESRKYNNDKEFFLVDPLDGTKEFINKNGEFTINIGLVQNKRPTLGVVDVPAKSIIYYSNGFNSFKKTKNESLPIKVKHNSNKTLLISRSHLDRSTYLFLEKLKDYKTIEVGSSLKLCLIAEGFADMYVRFGNTMVWDTAAAHAVLITAGGNIINQNLTELKYTKKDFRNREFFAFNSLNTNLIRIFEAVLKENN